MAKERTRCCLLHAICLESGTLCCERHCCLVTSPGLALPEACNKLKQTVLDELQCAMSRFEEQQQMACPWNSQMSDTTLMAADRFACAKTCDLPAGTSPAQS